ncbi:hypothetical protein [Pseudomonas monsensis]|uniref:hypothetical protein n=1 Tax=Pseudomonas monsensis TaxID=2745509 RepID=UPI002ABCD323|nr:hypothetical protein [Pseudomonas monsensis]MDZ3825868.1 hypothetical protein [Pseudomonas monsensis]
MNTEEMPGPRLWNNAAMPGAYSLATRAGESIINTGDTLSFEQYVTGYGEILNCKVQCYISSSIFDTEASYVTHSPYGELQESGQMAILWGAKTETIKNDVGYTCIMEGITTTYWEKPTLFFDTDSPGLLMTERKSRNAPFSYSLKTKNNIKPGTHYIDFYFTYFNGAEWHSKKERIEFKVNNSFEKHSTLLSALAAAALIVTIFHDGFGPMLETAHEIGKYVSFRLSQ